MPVAKTEAQLLKRDRARKKLRNILARTDKTALLQTMWILDRIWYDPHFQRPAGYDFPNEAFAPVFGRPGAIFPWELESLITELLSVRPKPGRRAGNPKSWSLISTAVNCLRVIEDAEYAMQKRDIKREISRIGYRQFRWQRWNWQGAEYVRWWSIFRGDHLSRVFKRLTGVSVENFLVLGIVWNDIFNSHWQSRKLRNSDIKRITDKDIDAVVRALTAPIGALEESAAAAVNESKTTAYRPCVLWSRPVVKLPAPKGPVFVRPLELLLKWRITAGMYYDVIDDREVRDNNLIGRAFEQYIRDLMDAKFVSFDVTGNLSYGSSARPRRTPDVLVVKDNRVKLVVECKAIKLPLGIQTSIENSPERDRAIGDLAKGVRQVCEFQDLLKRGIPEIEFEYSDEVLRVVVTLDDWLFVGHDVKSDVLDRAREVLAADGKQCALDLVERTVLCTADEIESLVTFYDTAGVFEVIRASQSPAHYGSPLGAVMTQCKEGRMERMCHPLSERVHEFLWP